MTDIASLRSDAVHGFRSKRLSDPHPAGTAAARARRGRGGRAVRRRPQARSCDRHLR